MSEKISIVIPFYNCTYIDQSIRSALNQTYPNIQLIVVNDGSTVHHWKVHQLRRKRHFKYIEKANGGTASALNTGIKNATGKYIAWLSSDDVFDSTKIEKQVKLMKKQNLFVSHTNFSIIDQNGALKRYRAGLSYPHKKTFARNLLQSCFVNGSTVMFRKEIFNHIGYFNESLKYVQDYDFWLRAIQHFNFGYLNQPLTKYRVHNEMGSFKNNKAQIKEAAFIQNKYRQIVKRMT